VARLTTRGQCRRPYYRHKYNSTTLCQTHESGRKFFQPLTTTQELRRNQRNGIAGKLQTFRIQRSIDALTTAYGESYTRIRPTRIRPLPEYSPASHQHKEERHQTFKQRIEVHYIKISTEDTWKIPEIVANDKGKVKKQIWYTQSCSYSYHRTRVHGSRPLCMYIPLVQPYVNS